MHFKSLAAVAAALSLGAVPASAQQREGDYGADLQRMITETTAGVCPIDLMAGPLLTACEQQLPQMSAGLASLGAVQSMTFTGAEETPGGRIETYRVVFANGVSMSWSIGAKADGKYSAAFTSG